MSLLNFLKTNENSRKVFGKRELKIIEKQMLGINLTQSEKNRLSRDIRKKLAFIKEASAFSNEFSLKKSSEIKKIIKNSMEIILADESSTDIKKIWLFGSATENKLNFSSDIDLAVEFPGIGLKEATLFRKRISGKVNSKVDIQIFNLLPDKIRNHIINKGKVIYQ